MLNSIGLKRGKNEQTDIVYLDFIKAFDPVDHYILFHKLKSYGVTGRLLDWFFVYLANCRQRVVVDGAASQWTSVTSGVPQGSILGPMLFAISDAPEVINNETVPAPFSGETKLHKSLTSVSDCKRLPQTLTNLDASCQDNNIKFNGSKCKALSVTRKRPQLLSLSTRVGRVTNNIKNSFMYDGAKLWNSIPKDIRESKSISFFRNKIATHIYD